MIDRFYVNYDRLIFRRLVPHCQPRGVDLRPLQLCLEQRIQIEDGKIRITPKLYLDDLKRPDASGLLQANQNRDYPFTLISRRLPRSHNTWPQNSQRLVKGKNPCTLQMNASDGRKIGVEDGQVAKARSETCSIQLPVEIDDDIFDGVVSMAQGWGCSLSRAYHLFLPVAPGPLQVALLPF